MHNVPWDKEWMVLSGKWLFSLLGAKPYSAYSCDLLFCCMLHCLMIQPLTSHIILVIIHFICSGLSSPLLNRRHLNGTFCFYGSFPLGHGQDLFFTNRISVKKTLQSICTAKLWKLRLVKYQPSPGYFLYQIESSEINLDFSTWNWEAF